MRTRNDLLDAVWDLFTAIRHRDTESMREISEDPTMKKLDLEETFYAIDDLLHAIKALDIDKAQKTLEWLKRKGLSTADILNHDYGQKNGLQEQEVEGVPLHMAVCMNNSAIVRLLLAYGADPSFESLLLHNRALDILSNQVLKVTLKDEQYGETDLEEKLAIIDILCLKGGWFLGKDEEYNIEDMRSSAAEIFMVMEAKTRLKNKLETKNMEEPKASYKEDIEKLTAENTILKRKYSFMKKILERIFFEKKHQDFIRHIRRVKLEKIKRDLTQDVFELKIHHHESGESCSINLSAIKDPSHPYHAGIVLEALCLPEKEVLDFLISQGFSMAVLNETGETPLHYAVRNRYYKAMKHLMENGANPDEKNHRGETPRGLCEVIASYDDPNAPTLAKAIIMGTMIMGTIYDSRPSDVLRWHKSSLSESDDELQQTAAKKARRS